MKEIEKIKFVCGLILLSFAILGGLIFYLEGFRILNEMLDVTKQSRVWQDGYGEGSGASNASIFLGLCGIAGAYLLASVKPTK
jgi:hypothetical protein